MAGSVAAKSTSGARTLLITRAKITDLQRRATPKLSVEGLVHAEPVEIPLRAIYAARTVSNTFSSSTLVDHEQRKRRVQSKEFAVSNIKSQGTNETVYCTAQLINTSVERITLQAGTRIADVYNVTGADLIDGVTENDVNNSLRVLKAGRDPRQLDHEVREGNARVPTLLQDKLNHQTEEERPVVRQTLLDYQDLFKTTEEGIIPLIDLRLHEIDTGDARSVKGNPYRIPYALRDELRNQVEEMVKRRVLTKAATEWAAPVILIRKKARTGRSSIYFAPILGA
jgi:hypothetical protein